jgi:hypothetical protein
MRGLLDDRAAPIAASMTWQGTETAGLAAKGPQQREGWRHLSVLFRDGKSRESSGRRKTREDRHCEASGGAAGFRASRVLRGCVAPRSWEAEMAFDCAPPIRLAHAPPTNLMSALAHALKEKASRKGRFAKARSGAGWKPTQAGVLPRKLTEPVNALHTLEAEGQRGARRRSFVASARSSLKLRFAFKARRFCSSRQNCGRQRLALKRQPPCGGRGCGCRASWPCRRDCR